jgi:alkylated DNA repair dioxygenase AlkB
LPEQFSLFAETPPGPEGLRYAEEVVSQTAENALIGQIAALPLQPFQFGQYEGKRRVASFGFRYDYTLRRLEEADPIPEWLSPIIEKVEAFGGLGTQIGRVLCTKYDVGVGIGWRRDKPHFDRGIRSVAGLGLQVPVSKTCLHQMGSLHARGTASFDLHDVGSLSRGLGTQHPCRRSAALFDHLPDHGYEILMARPNLCYLPP